MKFSLMVFVLFAHWQLKLRMIIQCQVNGWNTQVTGSLIEFNDWYIKTNKMFAGIRTVSEVSLGLQYILADVIAKDSATLNSINAL